MLQTPSAVNHDQSINCTIYVEKEAESVDLPCGEVPKNAVAIHWSIFTSNLWKTILISYPSEPSRGIFCPGNPGCDKYGINESSLVVKVMNLSKMSLLKCRTQGGSLEYSYTTRLQVVGRYCGNSA